MTNASVSQNPRVVKEADALDAAGYDVTVHYVRHAAWTRPLDLAVEAGARWTARCLDVSPTTVTRRLTRYRTGLRVRMVRTLVRITGTSPLWLVELAYSRFRNEQLAAITADAAELYIGHNPQSLPIVGRAAKAVGARYAFDAEDLHSGEFTEADRQGITAQLLQRLEQEYLPSCAYVTASAPGISRELSWRYGIPEPVTVHNVFPLSGRRSTDGKRNDRKRGITGVSFYWYSQIVSLDRGLQDAIRALGQVSGEVELHIRGVMDTAVCETLDGLARAAGCADRVFYHSAVAPDELLSRAMEHDAGLCLEQPQTLNRDMCVTNKLFLYLLAGLALAATDTQGQREAAAAFPDAVFFFRPGDVPGLADIMQRLVSDPAALSRARDAALRAAETRWNWERESASLVACVDRTWGNARG